MRGRRTLALSMAVVAAGVMTAVAAYYLDPGRGTVGPMPGVGLALPAATRMVSGLDVRRLVKSPVYRLFFRSGGARPQAFTELQARTGLNLERDVDHVILSAQAQDGRTGTVAIVSGAFDRQKVAAAVLRQPNIATRTHEGRPLYVFHADGAPPSALAFLEDDVLALGTEAEVEQTVTGYVRGTGGLKGAPLLALVESVRPGSAVWSVGDETLLGQLSGALPAAGGLPGMTLPGLRSVVFSAEVDPAVSFEAIVQTADEKAAQQIAGMASLIQGMASMQGGQRPEMKQLASSISVTTEKSSVRVNGRLSDELLEALQRRSSAAGAPRAPEPPAAIGPAR